MYLLWRELNPLQNHTEILRHLYILNRDTKTSQNILHIHFILVYQWVLFLLCIPTFPPSTLNVKAKNSKRCHSRPLSLGDVWYEILPRNINLQLTAGFNRQLWIIFPPNLVFSFGNFYPTTTHHICVYHKSVKHDTLYHLTWKYVTSDSHYTYTCLGNQLLVILIFIFINFAENIRYQSISLQLKHQVLWNNCISSGSILVDFIGTTIPRISNLTEIHNLSDDSVNFPKYLT